MAENWIERRALRERILNAGAPELWHALATVLDDSCTHFNENYQHIGKLTNAPENGHRIIVTLEFADPHRKISYIQYQFDEQKQRILVTANGGSTRHFQIDADIDSEKAHCFIKAPSGKLSLNEFAKATMEDVLFGNKEPAPRPPKSKSASTQWS